MSRATGWATSGIVKGIVEAHDGQVAVENVGTGGSPAVGCRFRVLLPVP